MFPDRSNEIEHHKNNARKFLQQKDFDMARMSYLKCVESVRQQNINTSGKLEDDLKSAQKEYSEFVKQDPLYVSIWEKVSIKIKENQGIIQTDIYKLFPDINKNDISHSLYFASDHGKVARTKKGRTYSLSLT
jgi:hypothetical protein